MRPKLEPPSWGQLNAKTFHPGLGEGAGWGSLGWSCPLPGPGILFEMKGHRAPFCFAWALLGEPNNLAVVCICSGCPVRGR